ncbi:hypothetical protein [Celeribacter litoreus]|uniref:hypothetical protein n=1 Tax=Celeribacter litoreus TaxID=2876714 RepID=UPI001CCACAF6|nr:hypothetical protein [Celeribacter litoreus]
MSGALHSAVVLLAGLIAASVMVSGLFWFGFDAVAALRDRSLSTLPEAGLISDLGIFLMATAAIAAASAAWKRNDLPLATLALFCCLFAIDDVLLIHEAMGPWEVAAFALYGLLALIVFALFSKAAGRPSWPICVAIAVFEVSVSVDLLWEQLVALLQVSSDAKGVLLRLGIVFEDVPIFGGIFVLASYAIGEPFWETRSKNAPPPPVLLIRASGHECEPALRID